MKDPEKEADSSPLYGRKLGHSDEADNREASFSLKKEILPFVTMWMKLEDIILSEIIQTQNKNTLFICEIFKK